MHGNSFKVLKLNSLPPTTISIYLTAEPPHDNTKVMNFQRLILGSFGGEADGRSGFGKTLERGMP